jgi:hypothetical protein
MMASAVADWVVVGFTVVAKVRWRGVWRFAGGRGWCEEREMERTEEKTGGRDLRTCLCIVLETVVGKELRRRLGAGGRRIIALVAGGKVQGICQCPKRRNLQLLDQN